MKNDGWIYGVKAIAAFLQVSKRTLDRWLADENSGLPVRRIGGRRFANSDELRQWLGARVE